MVSAFDLSGQLITSLRDPDARLNQVTSANECDGKLMLGSLVSSGIGVGSSTTVNDTQVYIVNAFTDALFGGNPAAVVPWNSP